MEPIELAAVGRAVQVLSRILTERVLTIYATTLGALLFAWVMFDPNWIRFAGAVAYSLLMYLPLVRLDVRKQKESDNG
jgi:hypothetical protein